MPAIDAALGGGLRRGHLSEIVGGRSSGRTAAVCRALGAAVSRGELVALVDTCDRFDPESAAATGLDLSRLLWIRETGDATRALKAMNLVLQAGGFGLVVLDLADVPRPVGSRAAVHDLVSSGAGDRRQPDGGVAGGGRTSGAQFGRRDDRDAASMAADTATSAAAGDRSQRARWTGRSDRARLLQGLDTSPRVVGARS